MSERDTCGKCKKPVGPYEARPLDVEGFANHKQVTCDHCGNTMSTTEILDENLIESIDNLAKKLEASE